MSNTEAILPFQVSITEQDITDLRTRLDMARWPEAETPNDWTQGVPLSYAQSLAKYWATEYDMQRLAQRMNQYDNFITEIDGVDIHFIHVRSSHSDAKPLLLTHGWPGSIIEFFKCISSLVDPTSHGGSEADAFHLVIPSLPGFGFSGKPSDTGWGIEKIASAWSKLMSRLGYAQYVAQGGDWGSIVTSTLGRLDREHCAAIHINMVIAPPDPSAEDLTALEARSLEALQYYQDWDSGYSKQQSTRPQTLGYGLVDSPIGQMTWILEKFWAWTDADGDPQNVLSKDELLDNIMVYWLNAAGASSGRIYWESFGGALGGQQIETPTGCSIFPKEIFQTSRRFAENVYPNIIYWAEHEKGGHFAAFEQPDAFVGDVRGCFRAIELG